MSFSKVTDYRMSNGQFKKKTENCVFIDWGEATKLCQMGEM